MRIAMLGLSLTMGNLAGSAQQATIPFAQIERDSQFKAIVTAQGGEVTASLSPAAIAATPLSAGIERVPQLTIPRIANSRFYLLNGLHLGMAVLDVELTQHCIATHQCREGNPLLPSSLAGKLSVESALVAYGSFVSYRLKKRKSKLWWLPPMAGIASHGAGAATGLAHW
jgi:hypothetical protein